MVDVTDTNMPYVFIIFIRVLLITNTKTAFQENNLFRQSVCFRKLLLKKFIRSPEERDVPRIFKGGAK